MRITMNYGKKGLPLELPDDWDVTVIRKKKMPVVANPQEAVEEAFSHPIGSRPLKEEAQGRRKACIAICDVTRPVPNGIVLPPLIKELISAGIEPSAITILIATGLHRPNENDELREVVGSDWVVDRVRVINHFARNEADHVYLGTTSRGMQVRIDRRFVEADLRIAIGLVEPHFMAGYSGGRKVITPGLAHEGTIRTLHSAGILEHCGVANCLVKGNPLHEEQMEVVKMVGGSLAVNTVIDEERHLSLVTFGEIDKSHLAAVTYAQPYFEIPIKRRFGTVITSAAGYPLDRNYYQTVKGMVGVMDIVAEGGRLFIVSECSEGLGAKEYYEAQERLIALGPESFLEGLLRKSLAEIDEWESEMQIKAMKRGSVHLYSATLSEGDKSLTGVHIVRSLEEEIRRSVESGRDRSVAIVPEGPYVIPIYTP
jgi:lactate racemase